MKVIKSKPASAKSRTVAFFISYHKNLAHVLGLEVPCRSEDIYERQP